MAARILGIIAPRSLVPSRALTAFAEANPLTTPSARTDLRLQNNKKVRRGEVGQEELEDGDLTPQSDGDDSDYSEGSRG